MYHRFKYILFFFFPIFIFVSFITDSYASENLFNVDANTVALWRFNETTGSTVADETGINNGIAVGTTIIDGKFGKARHFNGINDYITILHSPSLTNFSQLTLEAWIYPTGFDLGCWNQNKSIIFKGVETPPAIIDYALRIDRNVDYSCGTASSFRQVKFSSQFGGVDVISQLWHEPSQWYYVVSTYDGNYLKLYVNGVLEVVSDYAPNITNFTTYPLYIDHHTWNYEYSSSQRMQGLIDEIRISKIARSEEEIAYYYNLATSPQNQQPTVSNISQYKSDGLTLISEEGITTESTIIFKASLNDPDNDQVKLQVELKESGQLFDETDILESGFVNSGSEASIARYDLIKGKYHWRARAVDDKGDTSNWQEFGIAGNVDFIVKTLQQVAADLTKELANHPEGYLWGSKGWDYGRSEFISSSDILAGYEYFRGQTGVGVDCSGLITWAFDRAFDPFVPAADNFVKYVNADGLYRDYQSNSVAEAELLPGDAMFFDWNSDGYIDHTAMYVGESGGYDVVNAADKVRGIITEVKNIYKLTFGFEDFRRIHQADVEMEISTGSPVDLAVTDPDGFTITANSIIPSDEEYIREVPGALYYLEMEQGLDGNPIDRVYSPVLKTGNYIIEVIPSAGSLPTDTYDLEFVGNGQTTILADNVPISEIPSEGYGVAVGETGTINTFIPVSIDVKPGSYPNSINLGSGGNVPVAIFGTPTFDVNLIDSATVTLANAPVKLKGNGQPMISYQDVNEDSIIDIVIHVITEDLELMGTDVQVELNGFLLDGRNIKGFESIRVVP